MIKIKDFAFSLKFTHPFFKSEQTYLNDENKGVLFCLN